MRLAQIYLQYDNVCFDLKQHVQGIVHLQAAKSFGINEKTETVKFCLKQDGTEFEGEYFKPLPNDTVLIILKEGELWAPGK